MIPQRKPKSTRIQLNRLFESVEEMNAFVSDQHKDAVIVKIWNVSHICCEIEIPEYKKDKK